MKTFTVEKANAQEPELLGLRKWQDTAYNGLKTGIKFVLLVILLAITLSASATQIEAPGLYIIENHQKGCTIKKWEPTYTRQKNSPTIVSASFFQKQMRYVSEKVNKKETKAPTSGKTRLTNDNHELHIGPRGGVFHYSASGEKIYHKKEIKAPKTVIVLAKTDPVLAKAVVDDISVPTTDIGSDIVYITSKGDRYHKDGCRYLSKSQIPIPRTEAEKEYERCTICNP